MDKQETSLSLSGKERKERFQSLFQIGLYSDLILVNTDPITNEISKFNVHKCILAVNSPVWETSIKWIQGNTLTVSGFRTEVISFLLAFSYQNTDEFSSISFCLDILTAADFYCMPKLIKHCANFIYNKFSFYEIVFSDLVEIFNKAAMIKTVAITELCLGYIVDHVIEFLYSGEFTDLNKEAILEMVTWNKYLCDEYVLVDAIIQWTYKNVPHENVKEFLIRNGIMGAFRFKNISHAGFNDLASHFPYVFDTQDIASISEIISNAHDVEHVDFVPNCLIRGTENVNEGNEIIVGRPPFEFVETFKYHGVPVTLSIMSVLLDVGCNLYFQSFKGKYEETLCVCINGVSVSFRGVVDRSNELTIHFPNMIQIQLNENDDLNVKITFRRPGIYKKNFCLSDTSQGLYRIRRGIIKQFFVSEDSE